MNNTTTALSTNKKPRTFVPEAFVIDSWATLVPYFDNLQNRNINAVSDLKQWLRDRSELESIVQEDAGWRYIRMTCDTTDQASASAYEFFVNEIEPKMAPIDNELNLKMINSPFINHLDEQYKVHLRDVKEKVKLYREENIPLFTQLQMDAQQYAVIAGAMTVTHNGKELTLQQAANLLKENDRSLRESIYKQIQERRLQDRDKLDELYTKLIKNRHQVALNAGFQNFRDYSFAAMRRFDYSIQDCFNFHEAISASVVPLLNMFDTERKQALHVDVLRPWDKEVDTTGKPALKPFSGEQELMDKSIACFATVNPFLGECITALKALKHVDLESRKGKAPGGYNYPLYESNVPFIFMNATGSLQDLVTMVHEGGHAVHSIVTGGLEYMGMKGTPSEVAELASMSMELITMEHWDIFFSDKEELKRARIQHLEDILKVLPWIAAIDRFQHWVYTNPEHTIAQRTQEWTSIYNSFTGNITDWSGLEQFKANIWQKQLHLFEVPFYYIEYGMAQLGAIAMWRSYKNNPQQALTNYVNALKLGYTKTIGEIYTTAGIRFDFSKAYVEELTEFVKNELALLA